MSRPLYALVGAATLLAVGHHLDHVLRGLTGWPREPQLTAFTLSLLIYPAIAAGVLLSLSGRAGPGFWTILAAGGAIFLVLVHVGPSATDSVTTIPGGYESPVAGALALAELAALVAVLCLHAAYDATLWRRRLARGSV